MRNPFTRMFDDDPTPDEETTRPDKDDRNSDDPDDAADERSTRPAGIAVPNTTFGHKTADELLRLASRLGVTPPISRQPHTQLGSDPLHAEELGSKRRLQSQTRQQLTRDLSNASGTIQIIAGHSTGTLVRKLLDVREAMVRPIDVFVQSERLEGPGEPSAAAAVLTALTMPLYDRGTIMLDNRAKSPRVDFGAVPELTARFVGTLAHPAVDRTDFGQGYWTGWYTSVPTGDRRQEDLNQVVNRELAGQEFWFSERNQRFFDPDPDPEHPDPFHDETEYIAVCPPRYGSVAAREGRTLDKVTADVDAIHLVGLRKLNRRWVKALKRDAVNWLEAQLEDGQNKYADRWRDLCEDNGVVNPLEEFHRFKREHLADELPD